MKIKEMIGVLASPDNLRIVKDGQQVYRVSGKLKQQRYNCRLGKVRAYGRGRDKEI